MLGNRALQAGVTNVTAVGTTTLGFAPGTTSPADLVTVSAASAATIALPVISLTGTTLGIGGNQRIVIANYAAQAVAVIAGGSDSIVGSTATIAANAAATLISNSANNTWYRY